VIVAKSGIAAPFWINALSNLGIVGALCWWRQPQMAGKHLPVERFGSALRTGFRYARNNAALRSTMVRGAAFFLFASSYWALLPLVAREQIAGGADLYGFMLGVIGVGAVGGTFVLPALNSWLAADRLVAAGTAATALAMVLYALARAPATALLASLIAGVSWIAVLSSLNVSAQVALPDWVRGRGLAMYATSFFGCLSAGSAIWGHVAGSLDPSGALYLSAAGALLAIPLTWRWKLPTGAGVDLAPSMHWPAPSLLMTSSTTADRFW
jgi:hypothetical protein